MIACNHASYLDPIANTYALIRAGRRPRFLAKDDLFKIPIVGAAMRGCRQIPVRRGARDGSSLRLAEAALAAGEVVVVYPEGTVTRRDDGLPMEGKTGIARLALATEVPVTPMVSWGSAPVWQKSGPGSLRPRRPVWVAVGDAIDLRERLGRDDDPGDPEVHRVLTRVVMQTLTTMVIDLRDRYPERWATAK